MGAIGTLVQCGITPGGVSGGGPRTTMNEQPLACAHSAAATTKPESARTRQCQVNTPTTAGSMVVNELPLRLTGA
jgi:hypothetical protein